MQTKHLTINFKFIYFTFKCSQKNSVTLLPQNKKVLITVSYTTARVEDQLLGTPKNKSIC